MKNNAKVSLRLPGILGKYPGQEKRSPEAHIDNCHQVSECQHELRKPSFSAHPTFWYIWLLFYIFRLNSPECFVNPGFQIADQ